MTAVDLDFPFTDEAANQEAWGKMARHWIGSGVCLGYANQCEVYGDSSGLQVKLKTGLASIQGHFAEITGEKTIAITANSSGNPRIDRVVLRLDTDAKTVEYVVLTGTPAGSPAAPALTRSGAVWDLPMAQVAVADGASTIAAGNVTDERPLVGPGVPGYLFPSNAARDLHLTAPRAGELSIVSLTAAAGLVRDLQGYNGSAWASLLQNADFTAYTPTWGVLSGSAPAIGNGTLRGWYRMFGGKLMLVAFYALAGTTTTFGSGIHTFSFPAGFTAANVNVDDPLLMGGGLFFDGTNIHPVWPFPNPGGTYLTAEGPVNTNMRISQGGSGGYGGAWTTGAYISGWAFVGVQ